MPERKCGIFGRQKIYLNLTFHVVTMTSSHLLHIFFCSQSSKPKPYSKSSCKTLTKFDSVSSTTTKFNIKITWFYCFFRVSLRTNYSLFISDWTCFVYQLSELQGSVSFMCSMITYFEQSNKEGRAMIYAKKYISMVIHEKV